MSSGRFLVACQALFSKILRFLEAFWTLWNLSKGLQLHSATLRRTRLEHPGPLHDVSKGFLGACRLCPHLCAQLCMQRFRLHVSRQATQSKPSIVTLSVAPMYPCGCFLSCPSCLVILLVIFMRASAPLQ